MHFRAAAPRPLDHFAAGNLAARRFSTSTWHGCPFWQFPPDPGGRRRHRDGAPRPASPFLSCSTRSHPRRRGRHPRPLRAGSSSCPRPRHGHLVLSHVFNFKTWCPKLKSSRAVRESPQFPAGPVSNLIGTPETRIKIKALNYRFLSF